MNDTHPLLADYPIVTTIPVLWGDEDAFGHVNNITYLRWAEASRVDYLRRVSLWVKLPPAGVGPILASIKCDYKAQTNYPGTVHVGTRIPRIGNSSVQMEHCIVSEELDEVAALVDSTLVWFDYKRRRAVTVPEDIRRVVSELEGRPFDQPVTV